MRIAFITSEYSGLPGSGGIGSYFHHAARCLAAVGNEVEVFTAGQPGGLRDEKGVTHHQLGDSTAPVFAVHAAEALTARHRQVPFDLLESAEFKAEGLVAAQAVPDLARVVRLHSPSVILNRYLDLPPSSAQRIARVLRQARVAFGTWRRGLPIPPIQFDVTAPPWFPTSEKEEREVAAYADLVLVMSEEMRRFARGYWWIKDEAIREVPNPLQRLPPSAPASAQEKKHPVLGFAGRLEPRKGVLELARALREVLPRHPDWSVELAGRAMLSCLSGADVAAMARETLASFGNRVRFLGPLPPAEMSAFLDRLDLYVFPSLWDNFPYAVLEGMDAGKAIVATRTGAVEEMLGGGQAGLLVEPGNIAQLARALDSLMGDADRRRQLGVAAQERAHTVYGETAVTTAILDAYRLALERRDRRKARIQASS